MVIRVGSSPILHTKKSTTPANALLVLFSFVQKMGQLKYGRD